MGISGFQFLGPLIQPRVRFKPFFVVLETFLQYTSWLPGLRIRKAVQLVWHFLQWLWLSEQPERLLSWHRIQLLQREPLRAVGIWAPYGVTLSVSRSLRNVPVFAVSASLRGSKCPSCKLNIHPQNLVSLVLVYHLASSHQNKTDYDNSGNLRILGAWILANYTRNKHKVLDFFGVPHNHPGDF